MAMTAVPWASSTIEFLERYHFDGRPYTEPTPAFRVARKMMEFGDNHEEWAKTHAQIPLRRAAVTALIEDPEAIKRLSEKPLAIYAVFSPEEQAMLGIEGIKQAFLEAPDCIRMLRQI